MEPIPRKAQALPSATRAPLAASGASSDVTYLPSETILAFARERESYSVARIDPLWLPGMDVSLKRADSALSKIGVQGGQLERALRDYVQGEKPAGRLAVCDNSSHPLELAAQTLLGVTLARLFLEQQGPPVAVMGESRGEFAAFCIAGALELEESIIWAYRWAEVLGKASAALGLRMATIAHLPREELEEVAARFAARLVVSESPIHAIVSLPHEHLGALTEEVTARGGRVMIGPPAYTAHDPRLKPQQVIGKSYQAFLRALEFRPAVIPLISTLNPGATLVEEEQMREHALALLYTPVRWYETLGRAREQGCKHLLQLELPLLSSARLGSTAQLGSKSGALWQIEAVGEEAGINLQVAKLEGLCRINGLSVGR